MVEIDLLYEEEGYSLGKDEKRHEQQKKLFLVDHCLFPVKDSPNISHRALDERRALVRLSSIE